MNSLNENDLTIRVMEHPGVLCLQWHGKSTDRQPQRVLHPFLVKAIDDAGKRELALEMHFEGLLHFNSSTIGCLIQAIQHAQSRGIRLRLVYDAQRVWQRVSFEALRVFTRENSLLELLPASEHR